MDIANLVAMVGEHYYFVERGEGNSVMVQYGAVQLIEVSEQGMFAKIALKTDWGEVRTKYVGLNYLETHKEKAIQKWKKQEILMIETIAQELGRKR